MTAPINDIHLKNQVWKMNRLTRPYLMGIVNVTPDSFYDGGECLDILAFQKKIEKMIPVVDVIDIGGESTRPGARPVPMEEEIRRVIPQIEWIKKHYPKSILSIDTYKVKTARKALEAGADIINDVTAGDASQGDMLKLAKELDVPIILMHMKGKPESMQDNVQYRDVIQEIYEYFSKKKELSLRYHLNQNKIMIDPGLGFGKYLQHNLKIIKNLGEFRKLGYPVLVGASHKKMIKELTGEIIGNRLYGSIGVHLAAWQQGASLIRIHNPVEMSAVLEVYSKLVDVSY